MRRANRSSAVSYAEARNTTQYRLDTPDKKKALRLPSKLRKRIIVFTLVGVILFKFSLHDLMKFETRDVIDNKETSDEGINIQPEQTEINVDSIVKIDGKDKVPIIIDKERLRKNVITTRLGIMEVLPNEELVKRRSYTNISLVISHCEENVGWIRDYVGNEYSIADITIYSKCGNKVEGLDILNTIRPVEVITLPNYGRCDHTYAYWIKEHYQTINKETSGEDIVLFLKDNSRFRGMYNTIDELFTHTSEAGFGCVKKPECDCNKICDKKRHLPTILHNREYLFDFSLDEYSRVKRDENNEFLSDKYTSLKTWINDMKFEIPQSETVPVCYAGMFAAKKKQVLNQPESVWQKMERSLSRANNIIEGHYAERVWAVILSDNTEHTAQDIDKIFLRHVKEMVKKPTDGTICGMTGMLYVRSNRKYQIW